MELLGLFEKQQVHFSGVYLKTKWDFLGMIKKK